MDMGGSACELAACLMDDYEVSVIDPYDGRGFGPTQMKHLTRKYPKITFIRDILNQNTDIEQVYDVVISTSVMEHVDPGDVPDTLRGVDKALVPRGYSIHAIDFTLRGDVKMQSGSTIRTQVDGVIKAVLSGYNIPYSLDHVREEIIGDYEAYFLTPVMYQRWKKKRSYDAYPWRQVCSLNLIVQVDGS